MTEPPPIETARLVLRGHATADFEEMVAMWAEPAVVAALGGRLSSRHDCWMRLLRYRGLWPVLGFGYWAVRSKADGTFVGDIGFGDFCRDVEPSTGGLPEAGWVFAPRWHGKGLAGEALRAILEWLDRQSAHPVSVCLIGAENTASLRLAASGGFGEARAVRCEQDETLLLRRERDRDG